MQNTLVNDKSTHQVPVIEVKLLPCETADSLSVVKVKDFTCVVRTSDWKDGDLAAWIPPDSIVDISRQEFSFLTKPLIRVKRLRKVLSYGLLVPAPPTLKVGDNAASVLGVTHYDPEEQISSGRKSKKDSLFLDQLQKSPKGTYFKYDVDSFLQYCSEVMIPGEEVVVTEKIHGENSRFVCVDDELYAGSRNTWKREFATCKYTKEELLEKIGDPDKVENILNRNKPKNKWWKIYDKYLGLSIFCTENPGFCVYGELYGDVKEMKYGCSPGETRFAAFDILMPCGNFMNYHEFKETCNKYGIPMAPELVIMPYDKEKVISFTSGKSTLPGAEHIREGVVVKTTKERWHDKLGRVCLKIVSPEYYEGKYHAF